MEKILTEILSADKNILSRRDDLIAALDEKVPGNLSRDYTPIKKAINLNVGEIFFVEDLDSAKARAAEILKASGMQEARINFVVETFANAVAAVQPPEPEISKPEIAKPEISLQKNIPTSAPQKISEPVEAPPPQPTPPLKQNSPPPAEESNSTIKILVGVICVLLVAIFAMLGRSDDAEVEETQTIQETIVEEKPTPVVVEPPKVVERKPERNYRSARTELSLNGIDLDTPLADVENILGRPREIQRSDQYYDQYIYSDEFSAAVNNGKVEAFVTRRPADLTYRGLHVGSSYGDVVEQYGTRSKNMPFNGLMLYEYPFTSLEGHNGLLRFAVRNGVVEYISVRVIDKLPIRK